MLSSYISLELGVTNLQWVSNIYNSGVARSFGYQLAKLCNVNIELHSMLNALHSWEFCFEFWLTLFFPESTINTFCYNSRASQHVVTESADVHGNHPSTNQFSQKRPGTEIAEQHRIGELGNFWQQSSCLKRISSLTVVLRIKSFRTNGSLQQYKWWLNWQPPRFRISTTVNPMTQ